MAYILCSGPNFPIHAAFQRQLQVIPHLAVVATPPTLCAEEAAEDQDEADEEEEEEDEEMEEDSEAEALAKEPSRPRLRLR